VKHRFQNIIRFLVSFGLLGLLGYLFRHQLGASISTLQEADWRFLLLAGLIYLLFILISAWRWQVLLQAQRLYFTTWYLARVFTLGLFFCKLLPTSIGGDVMRIAYTTRPGMGPQAFSATLLDRLLGFQSLTFLAIIMGAVISLRQASALSLGAGRFTGFGVVLLLSAILLLLVAVTLLFFNDRVYLSVHHLLNSLGRKFAALVRLSGLVERTYQAVKNYRHQPWALVISFLSGIGVQAALSLAWFFTARAVGAGVPPVYYFIFIPVLNIVVNIPAIGGLGVREAAFVLFFTPPWLPNRLSPEQALSTALLFLALDLFFALIGGVLFAFMKRTPQSIKEGKKEE